MMLFYLKLAEKVDGRWRDIVVPPGEIKGGVVVAASEPEAHKLLGSHISPTWFAEMTKPSRVAREMTSFVLSHEIGDGLLSYCLERGSPILILERQPAESKA